MIDIEDSVIIARPVDSVFAFTTDLSQNARWQTDVALSEKTSEGPLCKGSTYRLVNHFMGKRFETEGVIAEYIPNRLCTYRFTSGPVAGESSYIFEPVETGTHFITRGQLDLKSFKAAGFIVKRMARRQVRKDLQTLKRILENGGI